MLISRGAFISLLDVSSITTPTNCTDKDFQLRLTAKNGLFKFAFDTKEHLQDWHNAVEVFFSFFFSFPFLPVHFSSTKQNPIFLLLSLQDTRAQALELRKHQDSQKKELKKEGLLDENPLARRCREEESQVLFLFFFLFFFFLFSP